MQARNKNPDEFYYKMVSSKIQVTLQIPDKGVMACDLWPFCYMHIQDGRHVFLEKEERLTEAETKLMKTQDLKYVTMKLQMERSVSLWLVELCVSFCSEL